MIVKAINKLDGKAAAGPDGISAIIIKKAKYGLAKPFSILWNASLKQGRVPSKLKHAIVIPLLKPGKKRTSPESYRPVSLTSHIIKVFERVLKDYIQEHLEGNQLLGSFQHGFRKKKSCLTQLLEYQDRVLNCLETGLSCDSVYLDFAKAFDKVDLGILGHRLRAMGINGQIAV